MPKAIVLDFNRTVYDPDSDTLVEGAEELLESLCQNFPLVLYCKTGNERNEKIGKLGIKKFFKKIAFVKEKTAQDLINIAKELKVNPNEITVIGDRIKSEIAAAKKAGCKTIWFKKGKFAEEKPKTQSEQPDHTITKLEEIPKIVKGE